MKLNRKLHAGDLQMLKPSERVSSKKKLFWLFIAVMVLACSYLAQAELNSISISNTGTILSGDVIAKSGSAADIQSAINQIAAVTTRGRVHIPAGNFNFVGVGQPWQTVYVPAGTDIFGAPTQRDANGQVVQWQTVLVMPYDVPGIPDNSPTWFNIGNGGQDPNKPTRFSDVKLVGYRSINASSITMSRGIDIYGVINFRVDHCCFENTANGGVRIPTWYQQNLYCCGVIDHCRLYNTHGWDDLTNYENGNIGYGVEIQRAYHPDPGFSQPMPFDATMDILGKYTNHTVFIEDCYFSKWRHCVSSGHDAFYVFRHNVVDQDFAHYSVDVHGLRDAQYGRAGGRGMEVYENNFTNVLPVDENGGSFQGLMQDGGGCGVWFNNYVDSTYGAIVLYNEDYVASPTWHLADFYMWGTKGLWTPYVGFPSGAIDPSRHVVQDWNRPAYDPTDSRYPNVDPSWTIAGYKPYPYPFPLTLVP